MPNSELTKDERKLQKHILEIEENSGVDCIFKPNKEDYAMYSGLIKCNFPITDEELDIRFAGFMKQISSINSYLRNSYGQKIDIIFINLMDLIKMRLTNVSKVFGKYKKGKKQILDDHIMKIVANQWFYNQDPFFYSLFTECFDDVSNDLLVGRIKTQLVDKGNLRQMHEAYKYIKMMLPKTKERVTREVKTILVNAAKSNH